MEKQVPEVTTALACQIVRLDRARFSEAVAGGYLPCVPETIAGRARRFKPDDLLSLWYFRELVEDGYTRERAGKIACAVAEAARQNPEAPAISYVEDYFNEANAVPADQVPDHSEWDTTFFLLTDIRKVTTFRVSKARKLIAHYTAKEIAVSGHERSVIVVPDFPIL